ncbi:DNA repair protein RecO [Oceanobacter mangrovi]|uniref:DNA repair protein RecO n=1 Tax=Oceanobacter mangrovi TaxID=2862510 RepID=UPI001C8E2837|nr:DNA repair protein RecO C-terminal domain-containing protein [Oceanobacter mangrovi]
MQSFVVLHRWPVAETGWLLNVFTRQHGHLMLRGPHSRTLQLHTHYQGDWCAEQDWPRLKLAEPLQSFPLQAEYLYCGSYLNELLVRLLPQGEAVEAIYDLYLQALAALSQQQLAEPWLRVFEYRLLSSLGYHFDWHRQLDGSPVREQQHYQFVQQEGFVERADGPYRGEWLLQIGRGHFNLQTLPVAKHVLRQALAARLPAGLVSRELFNQPRG